MNKIIIFLSFVFLVVSNISYADNQNSGYECGGYMTPLVANSDITVALCHGPYVKIDSSNINKWLDCIDSIIFMRNKKTRLSKEYFECDPNTGTQLRVTNGNLQILHFYENPPSDTARPLAVETYNPKTNSTTYKLIANFPKHTKLEIDNTIKLIDTTIKKPFDGNTYFPAIYGSFNKLRDYAQTDPDFILSALVKYEKENVFNGEVAETLDSIIEQVKIIKNSESK